jgi:hypothetical protein
VIFFFFLFFFLKTHSKTSRMSLDEESGVLSSLEAAVDNDGWSSLVAGLHHAAALKVIKGAFV